jgi:hypothetical protein
MSRFYITDAADPEAPVELTEYNGLRPGVEVVYDNPALPPLPRPLVVTELIRFHPDTDDPGGVSAILNEGEYEVNADNLRVVG